jgi:hypothetical protein
MDAAARVVGSDDVAGRGGARRGVLDDRTALEFFSRGGGRE